MAGLELILIRTIWPFPEVGVLFAGVLVIRALLIWGLYCGS